MIGEVDDQAEEVFRILLPVDLFDKRILPDAVGAHIFVGAVTDRIGKIIRFHHNPCLGGEGDHPEHGNKYQ